MIFKISKRKLKNLIVFCILAICMYKFLNINNNNLPQSFHKIKPKEQDVERKELLTDPARDYEFINEEYAFETQANTGESIKFILLVTSTVPQKYPFTVFSEDNAIFVENECDHTNCYITYNRSELRESDFDMVAFNLADLDEIDIPEMRSPHQKYVFFSIESPQYNPVCIDLYDEFFNWTFTYRLTSDLRLWFFDIYDLNETKIGPPVHCWPKFDPIDDDLKVMLDAKSKIAVWFVSNCDTKSGREKVGQQLDVELRSRYGWSVDVYGYCGKYSCPRRYAEICNKKIEDEYFFYLAFENSFAEDYVTEKILLAVNNYAVPIVYGGANYSRFLPPDSYLDIKELGVSEVARLIHKAYIHREFYYDYFKWTKHVYYRHISRKSQVCQICSTLNDKAAMSKKTTYPEFRNWWNNEGWDTECPFTEEFFNK